MNGIHLAEWLLGLATGLGLAAACGFRVFVPLFVASLAVYADVLRVSPDFQWLGSTPALVCFGAATAVEIAGYFIPAVDNLLDLVALPAAAVAGTLVTAAFVVDVDPWFRWSLALIVGGGVATLVQVPTALIRGASTLFTGGTGNSAVATAEAAGSTALASMSVLTPVLVPLALALLAYALYRLWRRISRRRETVPVRA